MKSSDNIIIVYSYDSNNILYTYLFIIGITNVEIIVVVAAFVQQVAPHNQKWNLMLVMFLVVSSINAQCPSFVFLLVTSIMAV